MLNEFTCILKFSHRFALMVAKSGENRYLSVGVGRRGGTVCVCVCVCGGGGEGEMRLESLHSRHGEERSKGKEKNEKNARSTEAGV